MSELAIIHTERMTIRWNLLTGVSGLVLIAYISSADAVKADNADRPPVWLELGGQMEALQGTSSPFLAPFMSTPPVSNFYNPDFFISGQRPPRHSFGLEGKVSLQPQGSDWIFSIGARYGRSVSRRHTHYQTRGQMTRGGLYYTSGGATVPLTSVPPGIYRGAEAFSDLTTKIREQHLVLDFEVGRDVGIGIFGRDGASSLSGGLRAVEFSQNSTTSIYARPEVDLVNKKYPLPLYLPAAVFNEYSLTGFTRRDFRGLGPSFNWNASAGILGNAEHGELSLDWGINVAMLFGKQKAETGHSTTARRYFAGNLVSPGSRTLIYPSRHSHDVRSRSIVVPNVGGFAGLSVKYPDVKVALGYRADFFFGAIDDGIDTRKTSDLGFHGPFATVSIGLGG